MARYTISYEVAGKDGRTEVATMEANSARQCADIAFVILTAQYQCAGTARIDANSIERQFKSWKNDSAIINQVGAFKLLVTKLKVY